ncbi:hypothetical protein DPMN_065833 [Dreissena polymorpha]|uniref:Uncharacterized protein n=1 Tax=Dreissena polymorpha TaxID=45954 RepID=A0A9D3YU99_DREPO|nr:hypothetical protein DPMN_065833 [Dreissena polymorpha]
MEAVHTLNMRPGSGVKGSHVMSEVKGLKATAVTASVDGKFKLWRVTDDTDIYSKWVTYDTAIYSKWVTDDTDIYSKWVTDDTDIYSKWVTYVTDIYSKWVGLSGKHV